MTNEMLNFFTKQSSFKFIRKITKTNETEGMNTQFTKEKNQKAYVWKNVQPH